MRKRIQLDGMRFVRNVKKYALGQEKWEMCQKFF